MSTPPVTYEKAATPTDLVRIYSQYLNAGDVEGLMSMYDDDATFSPEFGTVARGTDEIRAVVTAMVDPPPSVKSNVTWVQQVGDHALVLNDYAITVVGPDGTSAETTGRSADVAHRGSDGGWRFFIDCVWAGS